MSNKSWQWQRCNVPSIHAGMANCADISGATSPTYTPVAADGGKYLKAVASYDDGQGTGKSAGGFTTRISSQPTTLSDLSLSGLTLAFRPSWHWYSVAAPASVTTTTVTATPTSTSGVSISIQPADSDASQSGHQVALGENGAGITVVVRNDDGSGFSAYYVTVTR